MDKGSGWRFSGAFYPVTLWDDRRQGAPQWQAGQNWHIDELPVLTVSNLIVFPA